MAPGVSGAESGGQGERAEGPKCQKRRLTIRTGLDGEHTPIIDSRRRLPKPGIRRLAIGILSNFETVTAPQSARKTAIHHFSNTFHRVPPNRSTRCIPGLTPV